jgi:hypothetical protein
VAHTSSRLDRRPPDIIKAMGCGPDKDEPGHDPGVSNGRPCLDPVPELNVFMRHGALHVWPVFAGCHDPRGMEG